MTRITFLRPKRKYGPRIYQNGEVILTADASVNESHSETAEISDHEVEEGSEISDHIQPKARRLSISLRYSATPIKDDLREPFRVFKTHQEFRRIMQERQPIDISTGLDVYQRMAIERYQVNRDAGTGQVLAVDLDLKEMRTVESSTVPIPSEILESQSQATGKSEERTGTQTTDDVSNATEQGGASILFGIFG